LPSSNRSGKGGNDFVGAFDGKGHVGDPAKMQAVIPMNVIEASENLMRKPTQQTSGEGQRRRGSQASSTLRFRRGKDDGMYRRKTHEARETGDDGGLAPQLEAREGQARSSRWRRGS
jgi:hypothetical protein